MLHVKALWRSAGLEHVRQLMAECCAAMEVVQEVLTIDDELQLKTALLLNNWWHERNQVREGGKRRSADEIAGLCGRQAAEINNLQRLTAEDTGVRSRRRWEKPPQGTLKLNVDGAFRD
jgi:hypothetical protein